VSFDTLLAPSPASVPPAATDGWIPAPRTADETGVRRILLEDLAIKAIAREREATTFSLAETLALSVRVIDELFQKLRKSALVEVVGMSGSAHRMTLTSTGRERADELFATNSYVGPAPVPLAEYAARVRDQAIAADEVRPAGVHAAFADMVVDREAVRQIGIAIASGTSLMLSGPSGTGKTSVAACIPRVFGRGVFVPHAVEVAGEIIAVFDPGVHRRLDAAPPADHDRRWVYCARPFVVAGGELTAEMLDLQFNPVSGFYTAPPQMKANAGVFVIDDFGRQRMRPEELLNRWIVPLDRGVDFLTLHGGMKFAVPFRVLVVFSTNMELGSGAAPAGAAAAATPAATSLAGDALITDAAFLRRIPNKVHLGHASPAQFHEIFRRVCAESNVGYDAALVDQLIEFLEKDIGEPLRPCVPRDLVRQITWEARYDGSPPAFTDAALARACQTYFALPAGQPAREPVA
jgi:predicted ATPase with chaperone activity